MSYPLKLQDKTLTRQNKSIVLAGWSGVTGTKSTNNIWLMRAVLREMDLVKLNITGNVKIFNIHVRQYFGYKACKKLSKAFGQFSSSI